MRRTSLGEGVTLSDDLPQAPGAASAGTSTKAARADHVHPQQTVPTWTDTMVTAKVLDLGTPAASSTAAIHAAHPAAAANTFPGPITDPDVPRSLTVTFGAGWDGGYVTVTGWDQWGQEVSEVFDGVPGATVQGEEIFATVNQITKQSIGTSTDGASVGTGGKLGLDDRISGPVAILHRDGAADGVVVDDTRAAVTPATPPDGAARYVAVCNVAHDHSLL